MAGNLHSIFCSTYDHACMYVVVLLFLLYVCNMHKFDTVGILYTYDYEVQINMHQHIIKNVTNLLIIIQITLPVEVFKYVGKFVGRGGGGVFAAELV